MTDVIGAASVALGRELRDLGGLGGSPRPGVHRAADGDGSVVVKSYAGGSRTTDALREEQVPHPASPGTRPRMQYRLGLVAESGTAAAAFAAEVLEHSRRQWGDLALALAPAYR